MEELIEKLKASEQNASGMFEIDEDTICALMDILTAPPVAWRYRTTDINGVPKPNWSYSEEDSLLGLYQPLYER